MKFAKYKRVGFFLVLLTSVFVGLFLLDELQASSDFKFLPKPKIVKDFDWNGRNLTVSVRKIEGNKADSGEIYYHIFVEIELSELKDKDKYFYNSCVLLKTGDGDVTSAIIDSEKSKSYNLLGSYGRPIHSGYRDWKNLKFSTGGYLNNNFDEVVNEFENHFTIKLEENCPLVAETSQIEY